MANLNLSQFGEKLFVADADHTFIWDTAASISKRVSRNSWLNSGTLTSDAPVTISQTWNDLPTAFTALKVNATSTNSAAGSLLLDLQLGGVSQFSVQKNGSINANSTFNLNGTLVQSSGNVIPANALILNYFNQDVVLLRDASNTLALRNGAAAQTFNVYGTSSASNANYARLALTCGLDGNATISTQALGTGTAGTVSINGVPVGRGGGNVASNVAIGAGALPVNTTAIKNIAIGAEALNLVSNAGSANNIAIGYRAGAASTTGILNAIGNSIFIGNNIRPIFNGGNNQIVIGNDVVSIGDGGCVLGGTYITTTVLRGNVGIGTTAPSSPLTVAINRSNGSQQIVHISNSSATGYSELAFDNDTPFAGGAGCFTFGYAGTGTATPNAAYFFNRRAAEILFGTTNLERMRITAAGNVGIGTTSPTSKLHVAGNGLFTGNVEVGTTSYVYWGNRCLLSSPIDGIILLQNQNASDFNRLSFGFNNLNAPALKRVGTELQVVQAGTTAASNFAAGDADLTFIEDRYRRKGAGTPEGVVTAPIGAVYHNTTGGAGTSFYVKESGTGNTGWVGK